MTSCGVLRVAPSGAGDGATHQVRTTHRSDDGSHEDEQPQWPGEAPEQEVDRDVLGVLDHEDQQRAETGQGGDGAAAEAMSSIGFGGCVPSALRGHEASLRRVPDASQTTMYPRRV